MTLRADYAFNNRDLLAALRVGGGPSLVHAAGHLESTEVGVSLDGAYKMERRATTHLYLPPPVLRVVLAARTYVERLRCVCSRSACWPSYGYGKKERAAHERGADLSLCVRRESKKPGIDVHHVSLTKDVNESRGRAGGWGEDSHKVRPT